MSKPPAVAPPKPVHPVDDGGHAFFDTGQVPKQVERRISPAVLAEMAAPGGPVEDLAAFFGMTLVEFEGELERDAELKRVMGLAAAAGRCAVRRQQYRLATAGDAAMLRHQGEFMLGQSSKLAVAHDVVVTIRKDFGEILPPKERDDGG